MKELIIFYSYGGTTKKLAEARAAESGADILEIFDKKRPGIPAAFFAGCFNALRMKRTPIRPITHDLNAYDKITVMAPVWAGHPAPAANNAFDAIPTGKDTEVVMVSSTGLCPAKGKIEAILRVKGCNLVKYTDIATKSYK